ncbi:ParB/Srx family N-terminal domain-containing protein [uncultured Paracoccus sp.]|uniref:ParB/Srx family N-terminal domain-containing protein n=1 Tax=uncultured Paracoccus sp. TaxID=189685 RepID=UPI0034527281
MADFCAAQWLGFTPPLTIVTDRQLAVEYRGLDGLVPYARNARTHSDAQVAEIAGSIREFGFVNPVLIAEDGTLIAGHGRVLAARLLGLTTVPAITLTGLSDSQRRALVLADNRIALNAGWDEALLALELSKATIFVVSPPRERPMA